MITIGNTLRIGLRGCCCRGATGSLLIYGRQGEGLGTFSLCCLQEGSGINQVGPAETDSEESEMPTGIGDRFGDVEDVNDRKAIAETEVGVESGRTRNVTLCQPSESTDYVG